MIRASRCSAFFRGTNLAGFDLQQWGHGKVCFSPEARARFPNPNSNRDKMHFRLSFGPEQSQKCGFILFRFLVAREIELSEYFEMAVVVHVLPIRAVLLIMSMETDGESKRESAAFRPRSSPLRREFEHHFCPGSDLHPRDSR